MANHYYGNLYYSNSKSTIIVLYFFDVYKSLIFSGFYPKKVEKIAKKVEKIAKNDEVYHRRFGAPQAQWLPPGRLE